MPDTCVGCGRDGGKDRGHPDGFFCDLCWHGEEGLEIIRLRAENEALDFAATAAREEAERLQELFDARSRDVGRLDDERRQLRAENEALMRWVHTDHRLSSFEDCRACAALRAHLNEGEAT